MTGERESESTLKLLEVDVLDAEMIGGKAAISVFGGSVEAAVEVGEEDSGLGSGGGVFELLQHRSERNVGGVP